MKILRDYQENIVYKVVNSTENFIICLPTGSGKTVIASAIMQQLEGKVIFVVPRLELIKQAQDEFGDTDIIWSNRTSITGKKICIASKDSLRTHYKALGENITAIFDEAHIGIESTFKLVQKLKPKRVLGLTATPERMDGYALLKGTDKIHRFGVFDSLLQEETVFSLQRKGYLSELKYYAKPIEGITEIKSDKANKDELSEEQLVEIFDKNAIWGDLVKAYEEFGRYRPALGFTPTINMAEVVAKIFQNAGYKFEVIHGGMNVQERAKLIEDLRSRKIHGLVNAALLTYGFDCPPVSYAFCCRHIKSRPLWFQIVGRILRPWPGKENAIFVDHTDCIAEFADPDWDLPITDPSIKWKVDGESKEQKQAEKAKRKKVQETMKLLQELDPLPADLVEVEQGNAWERLIRVLKDLRTKNDKLEKEKKDLEKEKHKLKKVAKELATTKVRYVDPSATFDFVRRNYSHHRGVQREMLQTNSDYQNMPFEKQVDTEHAKTIMSLKYLANDLPFLLDENTFYRSLNWWKDHWQPQQ